MNSWPQSGLSNCHDRSGQTLLQRETPHTYLGLDGLRGVAALVIVFFHAYPLFGFRPASGYLAVDLFFGLSGFVLAHAYERRFESGMSARAFMRIRLIRLYPLYLLAFVPAMISLLEGFAFGQDLEWTPVMLLTSGILSLVFMPTLGVFGAADCYPHNVPAWSLAYELLINLLFVLTWRLLSTRVLVWIVVAAGIALIGDAAVYGSLNVGPKWETALGAIPRVFFSFPLGVLLRRVHRRQAISLPFASVLPVLGLLAVLVAEPPPSLRVVYDLVAAIVVFPLLILIAAQTHPRKLAPAYALFGRISYAVYVLHFPILVVIERIMLKISSEDLQIGWRWVGISFVGTVLLSAYVADRAYDGPVRQWLARRIKS